ncbi:MAG: PilN domain-containing protein [Culicoidibacterales bacterium]
MQDINFFDHYQLQAQQNRKLQPVSFVGMAILAMVASSGVLFYQSWQLTTDMQALEIALADPAIQVKLVEAEQLANELTALTTLDNQVSSIVTAIDNRDANITQTLLAVSQVIPQTVTLDQTSIQATTLIIDGQAVMRQAIAEFQYNLKQLGLFNDVYVSTIQPTSGDATTFNFQLECQIGGGVNEN